MLYHITAKVTVFMAIFIDENSCRKLALFASVHSTVLFCAIKFSLPTFFLPLICVILVTSALTLSSFPCWYSHGNVSGMNLKIKVPLGIILLIYMLNFLKEQRFLPPDTHTFMCISWSKKQKLFGKFASVLNGWSTTILV